MLLMMWLLCLLMLPCVVPVHVCDLTWTRLSRVVQIQSYHDFTINIATASSCLHPHDPCMYMPAVCTSYIYIYICIYMCVCLVCLVCCILYQLHHSMDDRWMT